MRQSAQNRPLHVVFTMDCVPPYGPPAVPGPENWDAAEASIRSFAGALAEEGMVGTFFLEPLCIKVLKGMALELREAGMELGLLCHPQLLDYQSYLGCYGFDRQREIVRLAVKVWEDRMGESVETFRPGFFSANDYTYQVVCMEGFRQGSCSLPGRIDLEQCSLWDKAAPFPHHTDPLDRKNSGTMEFFEVPLTSDYEAREELHTEMFTPPHLRLDDPSLYDHAERLMRRWLDAMSKEEAVVHTLVFVTHNTIGWGSPEDPHRERLGNIVAMLKRIAQERAYEVHPSTVAGVHEHAHSVLDRLREAEEELI